MDTPDGMDGRSSDGRDDGINPSDARWLQALDAPTCAERMLYALGQLFLDAARGETDLLPAEIDVQRVATLIGCAAECEYVQDDPWATSYHYPGEVLYIEPHRLFPWRVLPLGAWVHAQHVWERRWADGHRDG